MAHVISKQVKFIECAAALFVLFHLTQFNRILPLVHSGTSFTIHMTREVTNCTTATNYGLEGEIRDQPSVPAIQGSAGVHGPWLELIPNRTTRIADTILTKT